MITEELKELVREEARNLREKATKEELANLDFMYLDSTTTSGCIYGMMTGNCYSSRAGKLIIECCKKVIVTDKDSDLGTFGKRTTTKKALKDHGDVYHSPIEVYIDKPEAQNANLIAYLKGETDTLEL